MNRNSRVKRDQKKTPIQLGVFCNTDPDIDTDIFTNHLAK
jgi:hypothetical protein